MAELPLSPEQFAALTNVSRETMDRLAAYVDLLGQWNEIHNLVAPSSLSDVWRRHIWDSAQLLPLLPPSGGALVDVGSGAGLPGLVLAALLRSETNYHVELVESSRRKCSFLQVAAEKLGVDVVINNQRLEKLPIRPVEVVTARALAPLAKLIELVQPLVSSRTHCIFPKGQHVEAELTEAAKYWNMKAKSVQSLTHPASTILCLEGISRVRT